MARDYGITVATAPRDSLVGGHPPILESITLVSNGSTEIEYLRGTVLAIVTASGKYIGLDPAGADGSESAVALLAEDVTVPATGDEKASVYVHGEFDRASLVWTDTEITAGEQATAYSELKALGIYTK